jgi:peptidyl-prolyl cis-trans isomerase D
MALISKIRERMWLVFALLILGVLGFALQDATGFTGLPAIFGGKNRETVGTVNGQKINIREFEQELQRNRSAQDNGPVFAQVERVWQTSVNRILLEEEAAKNGITVTDEEIDVLLNDLQGQYGKIGNDRLRGEALNPVFTFINAFLKLRGATDEQINSQGLGMQMMQQLPQVVTSIKNEGAPEFKQLLEETRRNIRFYLLQWKYLTMVNKSAYMPKWAAEIEAKFGETMFDVAFVSVPFSAIGDDKVKVEDADIQQYLDEHPGEFRKEAAASIEFVTFPVKPSAADTLALRTEMLQLRDKFRASKDDSLFMAVNNPYQQGGPVFDDFYKSREDFNGQGGAPASVMVDSFFSAPLGSIVGPYFENNQFSMTKVIARTAIPDSVEARHILVQTTSSPRPDTTMPVYNDVDGRRVADSIFALVRNGGDFASLAAANSADAGSKTNGGTLGMQSFGQLRGFVKNFRDYLLTANQGDMSVVKTEFGFHIIQIVKRQSTGKTGVRVAEVFRPLRPSEETRAGVFAAADKFLGEARTRDAFKKAADAAGLRIQNADDLTTSDYNVMGLDRQNTTRDIVKWAHNEEVNAGDVRRSPFEYTNQQLNSVSAYVGVCLVARKGEGAPTVDYVRTRLEPKVRNLKKAEEIRKQITGTDLSAVAAQFSVPVDTARAMSFRGRMGSILGRDPIVFGAMAAMQPGQTSKPIEGRNAVYVVQVLNRQEAPQMDPKMLQGQMANEMADPNNMRIIPALQKQAKIKDNRIDFY